MAKFHGLCKYYDESGKLESENNWKDGEFEEREHKKGGNKNESKKV